MGWNSGKGRGSQKKLGESRRFRGFTGFRALRGFRV